jgi:biopolymer transport protein ExbB
VCLLQWFFISERFWFLRIAYPSLRAQKLQDWHQRRDQTSWRGHAIRREIICEVHLALSAWLSTLRTLIAICPLLGLLGTVTGMINVFEILTLSGGDSQALANGIYRATIPTMSGLVISLSGQYFASRLRILAEREHQQFSDLLKHD